MLCVGDVGLVVQIIEGAGMNSDLTLLYSRLDQVENGILLGVSFTIWCTNNSVSKRLFPFFFMRARVLITDCTSCVRTYAFFRPYYCPFCLSNLVIGPG